VDVDSEGDAGHKSVNLHPLDASGIRVSP
jgi:hypothetical protein